MNKKYILYIFSFFILSFSAYSLPPSIDAIPTPQNLTEGVPYSYTVTVTNGDGTLVFSDNTANFNIDSSTGEISFTPDSTMTGDFLAVIIVMDDNLAVDAQAVNFSVNGLPTLFNISDKNVTVGSQFYFDINASDTEDGISVTYIDYSDLFDINLTTGVINFTAYLSNVSLTTINISANDTNGGMNSSTFQLAVNDIPNVTTIPNSTSIEDVSFQLNVSEYVFDIVGNLTYSDNSTFFVINSTTGIINFTPNQSMIGNNTPINISVIDSYGEFNWTIWSINISAANDAPTFDDISNKTARNGSWFTFDVNATDEEGDTITYYDDTALFEINVSTGLINVSINGSMVGGSTINISVNDTNGDFTWDTFFLNITENNAPMFYKNFTINITPNTDNYVDEQFSTTTYTGTEYLQMSDLSSAIKRTYLNFSLEELPSSAGILYASLNSTIYSSVNGTNLTLYEVNESWIGSNLTYTSQPSINESAKVNLTSGINGSLDIFDVLGIVKRWFNGSDANYGVSIRMRNESGGLGTIYYYSSDFSNSTKWPYLYLIYNSSIEDQTMAAGSNILDSFDLDDYFYDLDGDTLAYSASSTSTNVSIDSNNSVSIYSGDFTGNEYVTFNASDGSHTVDSNSVLISVTTTTTTTTTSTSSGGGGGRKKTKVASLSILLDSTRESVTEGDLLEIPVIFENVGEVALSDLDLSAIVDKLGLGVRLVPSFIGQLDIGDASRLMLYIDSTGAIGESYIVTLNANTNSPTLEESAIFVLDVLSEAEGAKSQLEQAKDLFKNNPECLELQELIDNAEELIKNGKYEEARSILDVTIESCRNLIKERTPLVRFGGMTTLAKILIGLTILTIVVILSFNIFKRFSFKWK